jgi:outer membrane receptor protein involved in Fe transport
MFTGKSIILYLIAVLSFAFLNAQQGTIEGVVSDPVTGELIPFATIAVFQESENDPVTGDVSDGKGNFSISLPYGTYRLVISFIGYESKEITGITIDSRSPVNLGNLHLNQATTELEEVEVAGVARTSSSKIDRTTYRASDFSTARGGTASDILSRLPSVSVSPDGEVSVRGASDFIVYLNGRPTTMDPSMILAQVAANSIESIEIITVPGARYGAHGAGGIININTRRTGLEGLSVSAGVQGGSAPWGEVTHTYSGYEMNNDMYGGNLDLLYNGRLVSVYGNLHYSKRNTNGIRSGNARILQGNGEYYTLEGIGGRPELNRNLSANTGLVFNLSDRSTLDASYFFADRTEYRSAFYLYRGRGMTGSHGFAAGDYWTYNPNVGDRFGRIHNASVDYNLEIASNSEISVMAAYEWTGLKRDLSNPNYAYDEESDRITGLQKHLLQSDDTPLNGYRLHIDFSMERGNGHSLEAGLQPQYLNNRGSFTYDTLNVQENRWGPFSSLQNDFDLTRGIYAAYLNYSGHGDRLSFMGGLRMEYTHQLMNIMNPDYFSLFDRETRSEYSLRKADWFPSLHLGYRVMEADEINVSAGRRINRPQTQNMAPFLYRRHHEVYEVGDPALEPEYMNNFEVSYLKRLGNQNIRLTGFYRGTENAIFRIYTVYNEENILIRSFTNAGRSTALGAELNTNIAFGSLARLFLGGSLYNYNVSGEVFGFIEDNTSTNWSLRGNTNIFLTRSLSLNADFSWRSATVTSQGRENMFFIASAALDYSPVQLQGWNFSVRVHDILGSNITNWSTRAYDNSGRQIFFQETDYDRYGPVAEIGITYSFNLNGRNLRKNVETFGDEQM